MLYTQQGHFLGNFKKKFGFKRERAPFVLTPDHAFVMGGRGSEGTPGSHRRQH
jgi:phosphatidylinositol-4,5-bisphosphate 3-kinase